MKTCATTIRIFLLMTTITGIIYPLLITGIAQCLYPFQANGSMVIQDQTPVGSQLIGQSFDSRDEFFHSRSSATDYQALPSGGSNLGMTSGKLKEESEKRKVLFVSGNGLDSNSRIPAEMIFASGSGLDPHISPEAAMMQVDRVCRIRNFSQRQKEQLVQLIYHLTEFSTVLFPSENRINVLLLNLETGKLK